MLGTAAVPAVGCVTLSFLRFNAFMFPLVGAVCTVPLVLIVLVVMLLRKDRGTAITVALLALLSVVTAAGSLAGYNHLVRRLHRESQPLIDALEAHKRATGTYPKTLQELVPGEIGAIPPVRAAMDETYNYNPIEDGASYHLTVMTYGFNHHSYEPGGGWYDWD